MPAAIFDVVIQGYIFSSRSILPVVKPLLDSLALGNRDWSGEVFSGRQGRISRKKTTSNDALSLGEKERISRLNCISLSQRASKTELLQVDLELSPSNEAWAEIAEESWQGYDRSTIKKMMSLWSLQELVRYNNVKRHPSSLIVQLMAPEGDETSHSLVCGKWVTAIAQVLGVFGIGEFAIFGDYGNAIPTATARVTIGGNPTQISLIDKRFDSVHLITAACAETIIEYSNDLRNSGHSQSFRVELLDGAAVLKFSSPRALQSIFLPKWHLHPP